MNGSFAAVMIFFMVTGALTVKGMLQLTLSLGGTRSEYVSVMVPFYLVLAGINSLFLLILGFAEVEWLNNAHMQFWFNVMDVTKARPDVLWFIQTLVLADVLLLFAMLSSLQLRFGIPVYLSMLVLAAINLSVPAARSFWAAFAQSFYAYKNLFPLAIGLIAAGALFTLLIWLFLSRVSLKSSKA